MSADFPRPSDHQYIASAKTLCVTLRVTQLTNLLQTRSYHSRELWVILPATPNFPGRRLPAACDFRDHVQFYSLNQYLLSCAQRWRYNDK